MAVWAWTLPVIVFLAYLGLPNFASEREELFAQNCAAHGDIHCTPFMFITVSALRAIAYSLAALISARTLPADPEPEPLPTAQAAHPE